MHSIAFYTHRVFTLDGWKSKKLMPYLDNAIFPPSKIKLALGRFVSKFWNESFGKKSRFRVAVSGRDIGLFFRWGGIRTSEEITPVWYLSIEDFFKILELYESMNSFFEFSLVEALIGRGSYWSRATSNQNSFLVQDMTSRLFFHPNISMSFWIL